MMVSSIKGQKFIILTPTNSIGSSYHRLKVDSEKDINNENALLVPKFGKMNTVSKRKLLNESDNSQEDLFSNVFSED